MIQITEPPRSTLAEAPTESTIEAVAPGEFHELDLKHWRCVLGCPRCMKAIILSHYFERDPAGIRLPDLFRCPVCGFTSEVSKGRHEPLPRWKEYPGDVQAFVQAQRDRVAAIRPDADLPSVAEAVQRGPGETPGEGQGANG